MSESSGEDEPQPDEADMPTAPTPEAELESASLAEPTLSPESLAELADAAADDQDEALPPETPGENDAAEADFAENESEAAGADLPAAATPIEEAVAPQADPFLWYVLKVQSNREKMVRDSLLRRLKIQGVDEYVREILVPVEKVSEIRGNKKRTIERNLYPGYLIIEMEMNDDIWFAIRETPGVADFINDTHNKPRPMPQEDIEKIKGVSKPEEAPKVVVPFEVGSRVKIKEGPFVNIEGDVDSIMADRGLVRVIIQIFGRPTPVDVEYWQLERA